MHCGMHTIIHVAYLCVCDMCMLIFTWACKARQGKARQSHHARLLHHKGTHPLHTRAKQSNNKAQDARGYDAPRLELPTIVARPFALTRVAPSISLDDFARRTMHLIVCFFRESSSTTTKYILSFIQRIRLAQPTSHASVRPNFPKR